MSYKITCDWTYSETINYAMQQNHVPVVKRVVLTNNSDDDLHNVTVTLTAEPDFAFEWSKTYDVLPAGHPADLGTIDVHMSASYLGGLSERVSGTMTLTVMQGETPLLQERQPITVLTFDEWSGLAVLPELAAAFVMPNHPQVAQIVREAADNLGKWSGNPSFTAYQSKDPNRVRMQAAAIYAALQNRGISYNVAPPSFEKIGQRVRLPEAVFAQRMGNCLDLSLLYAACMEAVGLHPLLIFTEGHAFAGVWLVEETFSESVQDDISLLTKRIASGVNEICVIESTAFVQGTGATFDDAVLRAESKLQNPDQFDCVVDVRRARGGSIRPLPLRTATPEGWEIEAPLPEADSSAAPLPVEVIAKPEDAESIPITRQKLWERRLLDLSLRNTLLNFRLTKASVSLMTVQLGELEDALARREEFSLLAKPGDWQDEVRSANLYQSISGSHPLAELLHQEFKRNRLRADLNEAELEKRLVHLYRSSRSSLEENGANTLYLALGLLKWYETNVSELPRYAPLVLIPVDIVRKSSRLGYVIRGRDEEPQINITLLEMLRQDFGIQIGGLDPLPRDDNGVDLKGIFTVIRHALMQMSRWDVEESAYLGLFSFGQFVMWNDIRTRVDALAENAIVASLMEGKLLWQEAAGEERPLDEEHPGRLTVPVSADSSQLSAIRAAADGQSFVLHGPPGTGKSQTITNMIASALAGGKRVLFVAEKMAALSVVQKRLEQIGLGPFCLELHSNKSTKKAVLDQLNAAMEAPRAQTPETWSVQADRLGGLRGELNGYATALHRQHRFGLSLFEAIAGFERAGKGLDPVRFDLAAIETLTPEKLSVWRDLASRIQAAGRQSGTPAGHPWREARCAAYSQPFKDEVERLLERYGAELQPCQDALAQAASLLQTGSEALCARDITMLVQLCELLLQVPDVKPALLQAANLEETAAGLKAAAEQGKRRDAIRQTVCASFSPDAVRFDARLTLSEWTKAELQWFLPKWTGQNRVLKLLKGMALPGTNLSKERVKGHLNDIIRWQEEEQKLQEAGGSAAPLIGSTLWNEEHGDWDAVLKTCDWVMQLDRLLAGWYNSPAAALQARSRIGELLQSGRSAFMAQSGVLERAAALYKQTDALERELLLQLQVDREELAAAAGPASWYSFMQRKTGVWAMSLDALRDWCAWQRVREQAEAEGLLPLLIPYERGELPNEQLIPAFERGLYKACANDIIANDERLGSFSGSLFEESMERFAETDRRFEELTRQEIAARLSAKVPQMTQEAAQSSEAGILQRAIRSGGRGVSIRKLFEQIPNLLPRLTPCMLMSPISVAQYLDPAGAKFDLVIFDEASQVPTAWAVGALARGKQAVIVGDPKQLPPTSFFSKTNDEEGEEETAVQDMESILDDALALGMPQMHLSWHYRSRHESLIAFSNAHYYDNKLLTFPSPDEPVSSVTWRPVGGFYDRGRSKQNRAEAEAVIAEISRRLKDDKLRQSSIGVVTFSSIQQTLIEDLLDEELKKEPGLELLMAQLPEPLFVKNLENVQGDERDVILFSVGYGPDEAGKISLNFGPLNRQGGWRRLNVAVSRARREMIVFSTLRSDQLSASRTSAQGVLGLKAFLDFAEKGKHVLPVGDSAAQADSVRYIQRTIADELKHFGYEAGLHIGTSGYRIDVAVLDPDDPGRYLLGILLDGPMYHQAKTARDRDILRPQVLQQLGWSLHRVWMPDWWENREAELRKIGLAVERIRIVRAQQEAAAASALQSEPAGITEEASMAAVSMADSAEASARSEEDPTANARPEKSTIVDIPEADERTVYAPAADASATDTPDASARSADASTVDAQASSATTASGSTSSAPTSDALAAQPIPSSGDHPLPSGAMPYAPCQPEAVSLGMDAFYAPEHTPLLLKQLKQVVNAEGPISRSLLAKRVLQAWGIGRMGAKIDRRMEELLSRLNVNRTETAGGAFFWPEGTGPDEYTGFRAAREDTHRRTAEDLPPEEVANAVKWVLAAQISLSQEDLAKQTLKALGYARSGPALDKAVRSGVELAIERGMAFVDGQERIVYKE
ncbi:DUF3320 domain-containing protein [Paenibacillus beijingensis]|uniref:DUF3320 domain-containing protein n=1 Tax=Paenibacillus beijingensis TaxID=1126833 RepID=UPI00130D80F3|nr:DUF3320 domain-containing protein [Paenibacillus beijingensis]